MAEIADFFAMGGYAPYVWPAYAIALIVIGGIGVASVRNLRSLSRQVAALEETRPRRARRARPNPDAEAGGDA